MKHVLSGLWPGAPIGQKAQPATPARSRKTAEAVNKWGAVADLNPAAAFPFRGHRCAGANEEPHRAPGCGHNWPAMLVKQPSMGVAYVSNERKITALAAG